MIGSLCVVLVYVADTVLNTATTELRINHSAFSSASHSTPCNILLLNIKIITRIIIIRVSRVQVPPPLPNLIYNQ